jgi:integrase
MGDLLPDKRLTKAHRIVQRALTEFGVTVTFQEGLHTLRRSAARQFFEDCADQGHDAALRSTAALLGHKSVITTEGYLGISGDRIKRNKMLKGRDFLPFEEIEKVTRLRRVADGMSE